MLLLNTHQRILNPKYISLYAELWSQTIETVWHVTSVAKWYKEEEDDDDEKYEKHGKKAFTSVFIVDDDDA